MQEKQKETKKKASGEQKELITEELALQKRQKTARIEERLAAESKKIDEIADALGKLLRSLKTGSVLSEDEYFKILEYDIPQFFTVKTGTEGLLNLIEKIDLAQLIVSLRTETEKSSGAKYLKTIKRLRLIESMRKAGVLPSSMIFSALPVIPPDLRPMVQLSGGRFATSDLNDLYRRVINRNNRLRHLMSLGAPEIILRNEKRMPEVFDILEEITKNHPVLLNRAPTLHKLGIQAFYPILIEGAAIALHPCVCAGYNADFDGDQMAVHIPLSVKAQEEAINLMFPARNLLKPADGVPITLPNKEMAVGVFYLTTMDEALRRDTQTVFLNINEVLLAHSFKLIKLREPIKVRVDGKVIETTIGRLLFNEKLPKSFGFINDAVKGSGIKKIVTEAIANNTSDEVADLIDNIKALGFYGSTVSGISVSVFDNHMVPEKEKLIAEAEVKVTKVEQEYQQGLITNEEKKRLSNEIWLEVTYTITIFT